MVGTPARIRSWLCCVCALVAAFLGLGALLAPPSSGHSFTSTIYVTLTSPELGHVHADVELEYDLLYVYAADLETDHRFFEDADPAFAKRDEPAMLAVVRTHRKTVLRYVTKRFTITSGTTACVPRMAGSFRIGHRQGLPYLRVPLDYTCPAATVDHRVRTALFSDREGYVRGVKTIVTYDLDRHHGSAALDDQHPSFSTRQSQRERFWEFFRLGAEHLLTGLDHILFLLALIAGSRRLREIVLAATTFTLAHSLTFVLAALGVVHVSPGFVEPVIALSIAVVAGWHLWRLARRGAHATDLETSGDSHLSLDRAGWSRLAVVFCFGLIHGLGFAGALGIDQAWSWTLLWSLLVFNLGIETVQLVIIALAFPVLALIRRRSPVVAAWGTGAISAFVAVAGLVWFVQRVAG